MAIQLHIGGLQTASFVNQFTLDDWMSTRFAPRSIIELGEFMVASGYRRDKTAPGRELFTEEKGGETLYLDRPIDFEWLEAKVDLKYPLKALVSENCVICDATYRSIQGANEVV
jgi:hypothetical protein